MRSHCVTALVPDNCPHTGASAYQLNVSTGTDRRDLKLCRAAPGVMHAHPSTEASAQTANYT
jgi:hypothetical protein